MAEPEIQCHSCGVLNSSQSQSCGACGKALYTVDATLQSGEEIAATTPSVGAISEDAHTELPDSDLAADIASGDTVDGTLIGRPDHTLIGTMVGEYQVSAVIGEGGMGTVFSGVHPLIGKEVAIKVLKPSLSDDAEVMERFLAEAKAVNTIRHPNIIDIFSFGQLADGAQYFVMEHMSGRSLAQFLKERKTASYVDALSIMKQVLDALKAAHERGIVHRDLKPDNIYLADHPSGGFIAKLLDFGIAKFTEDGISVGHTRTGVPIGTPLYMSPEQCRGRDVAHYSDIYSLGIIMYEMFTGRPPFAAKTVYQLVNSHVHQAPVKPSSQIDFPNDLERIILWCLAKDSADRPASATKLANVLIPVLEKLAAADQPAPTPMPSLPEDAIPDDADSFSTSYPSGASTTNQETGSSRTGLLILAGVVVVAVAVVLVILLTRGPPKENKPSAPTPPPVAVKVAMDARVMAVAPATVWLQFMVKPENVAKIITVDGKRVSGKLYKVPKSRATSVRIRIEAKGYETYQDDWLPVSDYTLQLQLQLVKPGNMSAVDPMGRRRRRRRRTYPMVMSGMQPAAMPVMRPDRIMGIDMLE